MTNAETSSSIVFKINIKFHNNFSENHTNIVLVYKIVNETSVQDNSEFINVEDSTYLKIEYKLNYYKNEFKNIRNVLVDICKAVKTIKCVSNDAASSLHYTIQNLMIKGHGTLRHPILTDDASFEIAKQAADYLTQTQDVSGGWPMKIIRQFHDNDRLYLERNWNSAMLQGHALSLLTRLYLSTKNIVYLNSALNAIKIFNKSVDQNGVRTYFHNKFIWYEEYPTKPNSIFVLNGFIYSLIGLLDMKNCLKMIENENYKAINSLYLEGINSLKTLLPMFDSGTRTFYDLRHISNAPNSEPNLARWDYHILHINLLLHLATVEDSHIFKTITKRWIDYSNGEWAKHN